MEHPVSPIALVLNCNLDLVPYADLAREVCYRPLLEALARHPGVRCHLHLSGTVLAVIAWEDPALLDLIKKMQQQGQVELLGGTLAQNIPGCVGDGQLAKAMAFQRRQLRNMLQAEPRGFLSPEMVWLPRVAPLIRDMGYRYLILPQHALGKQGAGTIARYRSHACDLLLFSEHVSLAAGLSAVVEQWSRETFAAWSETAVRAVAEKSVTLPCLVLEAESLGLRQLEQGDSPALILAQWEKMLAALEQDARVDTVLLSSFAERHQESCIDASPKATHARWLDQEVGGSLLSRLRGGYRTWQAYLKKDEAIRYGRQLFASVGGELDKRERFLAGRGSSHAEAPLLRRLLEQAAFTLVLHQYEFGVPGLAYRRGARWELARSALVYCHCMDALLAGQDGPAVLDVNGDGEQEILCLNSSGWFVFSRRGGQLLYWIDRSTGLPLCGNEFAAWIGERFQDDNRVPEDLVWKKPLWHWLADRRKGPAAFAKSYRLRRRLLHDRLLLTVPGDRFHDLATMELPYAVRRGELGFVMEDEQLLLVKTIRFVEQGLTVDYQLQSKGDLSLNGSLECSNAFAPGGMLLLLEGRGTLKRQGTTVSACGIGAHLTLPRGTKVRDQEHWFGTSLECSIPIRNKKTFDCHLELQVVRD